MKLYLSKIEKLIKKLLIPLLLFSLILILACNEEENIVIYRKSCVYSYDYKAGKLNKKFKKLVHINYYNDDGYKIKTLNYNSYVSFVDMVTYKYDDKSNLIKKIVFNSPSHIREWFTYKYDNQGSKIEEVLYNHDGSICWKKTSKYDKKGNEIESYANGPIVSESKFTYRYKFNKHGNKTERIAYHYGKMGLKEMYKYDKSGRIIQIAGYYPDNKFFFKSILKYNEAGYLIEEVQYNKFKQPDRKIIHIYYR